MKNPYRSTWALLAAAVCLALLWAEEGKAYLRKSLFGVEPVARTQRGESQFLALLLPRITRRSERFTMSVADLNAILGRLRALGYHTIGLDEVLDFYARRRPLPSKAVLLAFSRDYPRSVDLADAALLKNRMKAALFLHHVARSGRAEERVYLSRHAVRQLVKSGAWELGWASREDEPPRLAGLRRPSAWLEEDGAHPGPGRGGFPLNFVASELALNDAGDDALSLHIMAVRPERAVAENLHIIEGSWPRRAEFRDDFRSEGLGPDWIMGWGIATAGGHRLVLLPTPRQTSAAVYLRGTEKWRDALLEFELARYKKEFWAYARQSEDGSYLRVGVRDGVWTVEQKVGAGNLPSALGRAPIREGGLPARVRLVLKGDSVIVQINGRMQFGKALRVHPSVASGRVGFGVYDVRQREALALVRSVRAAPVGGEWIAFKDNGVPGGFDEAHLDRLREEAVIAGAISPRWIYVRKDGSVMMADGQRELIGPLAGFYRCRLVPMAELPGDGLSLLGDARRAGRLSESLSAAADDLEAGGINLHLARWTRGRQDAVRFLFGLRDDLHARHRKLWVTLDDPGSAEAVGPAVDGVLVRSKRVVPGLELLRTDAI